MDVPLVNEKTDSSLRLCYAFVIEMTKMVNVALKRSLSTQVFRVTWFRAIEWSPYGVMREANKRLTAPKKFTP